MTTAFTKQTTIPITELEQSAFCQTDGNLRTKTLEEEFKAGVRWQKVPTRYLKIIPQLALLEITRKLGAGSYFDSFKNFRFSENFR
tara:strand:+ start:540 stop:797 length:258 start_codon:yes stop_codon:yes gene_type:complete